MFKLNYMYWLTWPQFSCFIKILKTLMRPALMKKSFCVSDHLSSILYFEGVLTIEKVK